MHRVANFDVAKQFKNKRFGLAAKIVFGFGCALAMIGLRTVLDVWAAEAGPFALVYPTVLIATLFGHWQAGAVSYVTSFLWAWYYVLAPVGAWEFAVASDPGRVMINAAAVLFMLVLAEAFRAAVAKAIAERDAEIEHSHLLQQEIEHRTKNNFALAASLLEMQKRREEQPEIAAALEQAISRIHSFSAAYANLAVSQAEGEAVAMRHYLVELVDRVTQGAFHENVLVELETGEGDCIMPREVAVAIGLFTNEALTNCAKYAFPDGRRGRVRVKFDSSGDNWALSIADDGVGISTTDTSQSTGIGERLLSAFAQQARADYRVDADRAGRSVFLSSQALN